MPYYFKESEWDESGYESGEEFYSPAGILGQGSRDLARRFRTADGKHEVSVLSPTNPDSSGRCLNEARMKVEFYMDLYPERPAKLFEKKIRTASGEKTTYRLILPVIPGKDYTFFHDKILSEETQILVFFSAVQALRDCHRKGRVVVDLKEDNIRFDQETGYSYLIDGGHSAKIHHPIASLFMRLTREDAEGCKNTYSHIAGECWGDLQNEKTRRRPILAPTLLARTLAANTQASSTRPTSTLARPEMDVFSLGAMMKKIFAGSKVSPILGELINRCQNVSPLKRPTLEEMEKILARLYIDYQTQTTKSLCVDFSNLADEVEFESRKKRYLDYVNQPPSLDWLINSHHALSMTTIDKELQNAARSKTKEIEVAAGKIDPVLLIIIDIGRKAEQWWSHSPKPKKTKFFDNDNDKENEVGVLTQNRGFR